MKSGPGRLVEIASEAFELVESSGKFIGYDFTLLPRFLLSGEFPIPSSATDDDPLVPKYWLVANVCASPLPMKRRKALWFRAPQAPDCFFKTAYGGGFLSGFR